MLLGQVISVNGVSPDPANNEVQNYPVQRDVSSVQHFLGLALYYRRSAPGFSRLVLHCMFSSRSQSLSLGPTSVSRHLIT